MTLKEMKLETLRLIEEVNPNHESLTEDPDIAAKHNGVINHIMFELARMKKIPKYVEIEVSDGDVIGFADIERECGHEVYQIGSARGVEYEPKANGTVLKIKEYGTLELDVFVYPVRITDQTEETSYEFELSPDVLEIMPYGIAADLLKSDISSEYGAIYSTRYETMLQRLDPRQMIPNVTIVGGIDI